MTVSAPARVDLAGGWSDTPPFCMDWGGAVLNAAVTFNGSYPIYATIRRLDEPLIRCIAGDGGPVAEYASTEDLWNASSSPGCPFLIPLTALRMAEIVRENEPLGDCLAARGGGLEIKAAANLPMGSGLGTSSILACAIIQALAVLSGFELPPQPLNEHVLRLEQLMTTGGGWQDQAGCIFPGVKLITSAPGLRQVLRSQPVEWTSEAADEFSSRMVLYYTGVTRIAKTILSQAVANYLARESACVNMLHRVKGLAFETFHALSAGAWDDVGRLMDEQWRLNQVPVPCASNARIESLLREFRPYLSGAKLAGAGGGGFMMLLARDPESAQRLRELIAAGDHPGRLCSYEIANDGMKIEASD